MQSVFGDCSIRKTSIDRWFSINGSRISKMKLTMRFQRQSHVIHGRYFLNLPNLFNWMVMKLMTIMKLGLVYSMDLLNFVRRQNHHWHKFYLIVIIRTLIKKKKAKTMFVFLHVSHINWCHVCIFSWWIIEKYFLSTFSLDMSHFKYECVRFSFCFRWRICWFYRYDYSSDRQSKNKNNNKSKMEKKPTLKPMAFKPSDFKPQHSNNQDINPIV